MIIHVKLVYFKDTGKYYSEGEHDIPEDYGHTVLFHEAVGIIKLMLDKGKRPGLVDGHDFHVLATFYTEHGPLSHLFVRNSRGEARNSWLQERT